MSLTISTYFAQSSNRSAAGTAVYESFCSFSQTQAPVFRAPADLLSRTTQGDIGR